MRREHGSGTYVRERPALRNNLERNFGVTSLIESFGLEPGVAERSVGEEPADEEIAAALGVAPGTPLTTLRRVRTADGRRIIATVDRCVPGGARRGGLARGRLAVRRPGPPRRRHPPRRGHAAPRARRRRARGAAGGAARARSLLALDQVDYTARDEPVLHSREHHLADAFEWSVYRRGPGDGE